jgi:hypothetical protein
LRHGAHRLMKSRSTGHPNVRPILDAVNITHLAASTQAQPATETARSGGSAECSQTTKSG